jgi:hypothetical protein
VLLEMPLVWLQAGFTRGEEMKTADEILEMVLDYGDSRQHEPSYKWSTKSIRDAIEELAKDAERYRLLRRESMAGSYPELVRVLFMKRGLYMQRSGVILDAAIDAAMKESP